MVVTLLRYTPGPEEAVATAARGCYSPRSFEDIDFAWAPEPLTKMIARVRDAGHLSTFEHATFTFAVYGVSRALTHQLIRHRHMSYEQESQRYAPLEFQYVTPASIAKDDRLEDAYHDLMEHIQEFYNRATEQGVPPEDARYVLPNATHTKIIITANARALLHFFELRTCNNAQWEIFELACEMLRKVKAVAPRLFEKAGATCVRGYCNEANGPQCPRYPKQNS